MIKLILPLLLCSTFCMAQTDAIKAIAQQTSTETLKKNLYELASEKMDGRMMGSHGDTLASNMVADCFKQAGLVAPYSGGKSYFQAISTTRIADNANLAINNKNYKELAGWFQYVNLPIKFKNLPVLYANYATIEDWVKNMPRMKLSGKAVIINYKLVSTGERLDSLERVFWQKGVKLVAWSGPAISRIIARKLSFSFLPVYKSGDSYVQPASIPEIGLIPLLVRELTMADSIQLNEDGGYTNADKDRFYDLKSTLSVERIRKTTEVKAPNVIGIIKGTDANADCIVISAHHDHDGHHGNDLYYGAMDNASGTVAIMEMARLMNEAAKKGIYPKRTIVFASYTGEERGLLGSFYYMNHPVYPVKNTYAVFNIDMLGRVDTLHTGGRNPDSSYAYILVKDTLNRGLRKALFQANESVKLTLDTHYEQPQFEQRRIKGSDQYPFYQQGVPFVRIDCGFAKEYHKPGDTPDKIDYTLLTKQTQLAFLTLWNMANE
jgi:hypothetical protein